MEALLEEALLEDMEALLEDMSAQAGPTIVLGPGAAGPRTRFPGPESLFGAPATLPVRHTVSNDSDFLSILLEEFDRDAFEIALLPHVALACKRALACTCYALRERLTPHLRAATLSVLRGDAIWRNALFVARLPGLTDLRVEGETCLPSMDLARYRQLDALKVGSLGPPAALFFGAAIATSNARLRLSDGSTIRNISALRSSPSPNKAEKEASDADRAALLGALASNQHVLFSALDALSYASAALGADREVVLAAVKQSGMSLQREKMWFQDGEPTKVGFRQALSVYGLAVEGVAGDVQRRRRPRAVADHQHAQGVVGAGRVSKAESNHYIVTRYKDGAANIGAHYDKATSIAPGSLITVIKLGSIGRPFKLERLDSTVVFDKVLAPGTGVVMTLEANLKTKHSVPPCDEQGVSGSLVARTIVDVVSAADLKKKLASLDKKSETKLGKRSAE